MSATHVYTCNGCGHGYQPHYPETSESYMLPKGGICATCKTRMLRALDASDSPAEMVNTRQANEIADLRAQVSGRDDLVRSLKVDNLRLRTESTDMMNEGNDLRAQIASALNEASGYRARNMELMAESGRYVDMIARLLVIARRCKHSLHEEAWMNGLDALAIGASCDDPVEVARARVAPRPRRQDDITRERAHFDVCGQGGCPWPHGHDGHHAGTCGCTNGCEAWDCPND